MTLKETVTVEREVTGIIADLVHFARKLGTELRIEGLARLSDSQLIQLARDYWDSQHGED